MGVDTEDVLIDYCNEYGISATASAASLSSKATTGKVEHAVTVYGTKGNYFICHYGWSEYSHVLLDAGLIGSCTLFQLN